MSLYPKEFSLWYEGGDGTWRFCLRTVEAVTLEEAIGYLIPSKDAPHNGGSFPHKLPYELVDDFLRRRMHHPLCICEGGSAKKGKELARVRISLKLDVEII